MIAKDPEVRVMGIFRDHGMTRPYCCFRPQLRVATTNQNGLWRTAGRWSGAATLDLVSIASHCLSLIREHGPLSADELGAACLADGVTTARQPAAAATSALSWNMDGRAFRVGDRFHAVSELLEGRWLTLDRSADEPATANLNIDLACLTGLIAREGLALAGGGILKARRYGDEPWTGPDGWLPEGDILGLRLLGGTAELRAVVIDEAAEKRGECLVERLSAGNRNGSFGYGERRKAASQGLLALLAEDDDLLREPVPPLSTLLPPPAAELRSPAWDVPPPFWPTVHIHMSPELYGQLDQVAPAIGARLDHWLTDQMVWLADSPLMHAVVQAAELADYDRGENPAWNASPAVLPFQRPRGE
jgi:hypothetical protein